ncbi:MAG: hypothetical protein JST00_15400 [Deltaproteobacteria bacterium]|nr:hypothetical protein [Deltaproteobacteria bacterium]
MSYTTWSKGIGLLAATFAFCAPLTASAHAYIMDPPARDIANPDKNARAHKDATAPCGGLARVGSPKKYAPGSTITVKWEETIGHQGCYQIRFSSANDMPAEAKNWQLLKQINDPAGINGTAGVFTDTVTLPNTPCPACTLSVLQLMQGQPCPNNADPSQSLQGTYYSCADICIGGAGDPCTDAPKPDAGAGDAGNDSGTTSSSSSSTGGTTDSGTTSSSSSSGEDPDTTSSSSGATTRRPTTESDSGCAVSDSNAPGGFSLAAVIGFVGLALVRRRRGA